MDQHPIPQNVTGFQFKLIGNMTVKQFAYLAVGVVSAVITYYIPLKGVLGILLKIILIPTFGASGAIVAFVPIDGRPIDVMATNFFKALFSPNQYVYHKSLKRFSFSTIQTHSAPVSSKVQKGQKLTPSQKASNDKSQELRKILTKSSSGKIKNAQDEKEAAFLKTFLSLPQAQAQPAFALKQPLNVAPAVQPAKPQTGSVFPPLNASPILNKPQAPKPTTEEEEEVMLSQKEDSLNRQLDEALKQEKSSVQSPDQLTFHQKTLELQKQLEAVHAQKSTLEEEIKNLKNELIAQKTTITAVPRPAPQQNAPKTATHVRSVPKEQNKSMGLLTPDAPNVITGTVKDPRGNVLPNILVEIKDKAGNPVRAFKTNSLGNFASATPLTPGTYTITLEDLRKQHTFDSIQITAANQIMLPIEIISYDKREELRKELFS